MTLLCILEETKIKINRYIKSGYHLEPSVLISANGNNRKLKNLKYQYPEMMNIRKLHIANVFTSQASLLVLQQRRLYREEMQKTVQLPLSGELTHYCLGKKLHFTQYSNDLCISNIKCYRNQIFTQANMVNEFGQMGALV